jgi:hypothetical protein
MNEKPARKKRKELLSYPREQMKIIMVFAILAVTFTAANFVVNRSVLERLSNQVLQLPLSRMARSDLVVLIQQESATLDIQLSLFTLISVFALLLGAVYVSHKIAGPIYRINQYLRLLAKGEANPETLRIRRFDLFADLADSVNDLVASQKRTADEKGKGGETPTAAPRPDE